MPCHPAYLPQTVTETLSPLSPVLPDPNILHSSASLEACTLTIAGAQCRAHESPCWQRLVRQRRPRKWKRTPTSPMTMNITGKISSQYSWSAVAPLKYVINNAKPSPSHIGRAPPVQSTPTSVHSRLGVLPWAILVPYTTWRRSRRTDRCEAYRSVWCHRTRIPLLATIFLRQVSAYHDVLPIASG